MKKYILLIFIPFLLVFSKEEKIGFVDSERIFNEYQATAAAKVEFSEFVNTYRDSASVLKQKIEELKAEVESQELVLSEEARLRKFDEIESLNKSYNLFLNEVFGSGGKVEQKNDVLMVPLMKKINEAVAKTAQQEAFTIVLDLSEGIFYASNELDLTDLVVDELNLEYGPEIIPGETKKLIAIFPFREENTEAAKEDLGQRCQNELYKVINAFNQIYKIVSKTDVNTEIFRRGYGVNIDDNQAYSVAHTLLCDYIIVGKVSKFATKIDYTISLKAVKESREIDKKTNSVTEEIKLYEFLNNDLRSLIEKIQD